MHCCTLCIDLPISKSIANRLLILQAMHGDSLLSVSAANIPDDVRLLHDALQALQAHRTQTLDLQNCGTAMRFLTAYCAQLTGCDVVLTGTKRMQQRPIGQLVTALRTLGADIEYPDKEGYPSLHIHGKELPRKAVHIENPQSTQFVSALLLTGVPVTTNSTSPYIGMTRSLCRKFTNLQTYRFTNSSIESDWSAAAFWYEYTALHGGTLSLRGLQRDSLQGDKVVADLFTRFGVQTVYQPDGITISKNKEENENNIGTAGTIAFDFTCCPDLYPAVAITCEQLGIPLVATGTESLRIKESDRLQAVAEHRVCADHRIAMALLAANLPCDDTACITKSYPDFHRQLCALRESARAEA